MTWDDFAPFILPWAPSCPEQTMVHHARQAAIDFIGFTFAWSADLPAITADGTATSWAMTPPAGAVVKKLSAVSATSPGNRAAMAELPDPAEAAQRIQCEDMGLMAYTSDLATLTVWPVQPVGTVIGAQVWLKPSQLSEGMPDHLFEQYAKPISCGALAQILAMNEPAWQDMTLAAAKAAEFMAAKNTTARIVERGRAPTTRRSSTRWF